MAKKGKIHISKNSKKAESKSCGKTFNYCMPCGKQFHNFLKSYVSKKGLIWLCFKTLVKTPSNYLRIRSFYGISTCTSTNFSLPCGKRVPWISPDMSRDFLPVPWEKKSYSFSVQNCSFLSTNLGL